MSDRYQVIKIDIDVQIPVTLLMEWKETREWIINSRGLEVTKVRYTPTEHGWHVWIHLNNTVDYDTLMQLQFLCGDDHNRSYFGQQRRGFVRFRDKFNILFNRKWALHE